MAHNSGQYIPGDPRGPAPGGSTPKNLRKEPSTSAGLNSAPATTTRGPTNWNDQIDLEQASGQSLRTTDALAAGYESDATNLEAITGDGDEVIAILEDNVDNNIVVGDEETDELLAANPSGGSNWGSQDTY